MAEIRESRRQRGVGRERGALRAATERLRERGRRCAMRLRGVGRAGRRWKGRREVRTAVLESRAGRGLGRRDGGARGARPLRAGTAALKGQRLGRKSCLKNERRVNLKQVEPGYGKNGKYAKKIWAVSVLPKFIFTIPKPPTKISMITKTAQILLGTKKIVFMGGERAVFRFSAINEQPFYTQICVYIYSYTS